MKHSLTIGGRQFRSYFNGPVAYIVICIVLLTLGFFFWNTFFLFGRASAREMFRWLGLILVFALPDDHGPSPRRNAPTIELLITARTKRQGSGNHRGSGALCHPLGLTVTYPISVSTLATSTGVRSGAVISACSFKFRRSRHGLMASS
jgi:ABC-2 type transport system permease protein